MDSLFAAEFDLARRHWQLLRWVAERREPRRDAFVADVGLDGLDGLDEADDVATVTTMTTIGDNLERANRTRREQSRRRSWSPVRPSARPPHRTTPPR